MAVRRGGFLSLELAGGQPGWHAGAGAAKTASAVRILRGPHSGQHRLFDTHGRPCAFWNHEPHHRGRSAGLFSAAFDSVLSCDVYPGRVPHVILDFWADRIAGAPGDCEPGIVALAQPVTPPWSLRHWRVGWDSRYGGYASVLDGEEHRSTVQRGAV